MTDIETLRLAAERIAAHNVALRSFLLRLLDPDLTRLIPSHHIRDLGIGHAQERIGHSLPVSHDRAAALEPALDAPHPAPVLQGRDLLRDS